MGHDDEAINAYVEGLKQEIINTYCEQDRDITEYLYWRNVGDAWHLSQSVWLFLEK